MQEDLPRPTPDLLKQQALQAKETPKDRTLRLSVHSLKHLLSRTNIKRKYTQTLLDVFKSKEGKVADATGAFLKRMRSGRELAAEDQEKAGLGLRKESQMRKGLLT